MKKNKTKTPEEEMLRAEQQAAPEAEEQAAPETPEKAAPEAEEPQAASPDAADEDALREDVDLPVYAAAITPQGPYKNGPGEINVPVACGGQVVFPGDILVGDADGVCVIRKEEAPKITALAREKVDHEAVLLEKYHTVGNDTERHRATYNKVTDRLGTYIY